jgi:hypothetical protein
MERGLLVELSRNEESALRRISIGIYQSEMRPRDVARLKLLALVEMRGSAVVLTPIGVRRVAKLPDRWEADEPYRPLSDFIARCQPNPPH